MVEVSGWQPDFRSTADSYAASIRACYGYFTLPTDQNVGSISAGKYKKDDKTYDTETLKVHQENIYATYTYCYDGNELSFILVEPIVGMENIELKPTADEAVLAIPSDVSSLSKICCLLKKHKLAPYIIGNGTNILFPDEGLNDLFIISTAKLGKLFMIGEDAIYAEAGVSLAKLAGFAQQNGLEGLEFASGIPGSVGGGVVMNAGAYGGEMAQVLTSVTALDLNGNIQTIPAERCGFGYRRSIFSDGQRLVLEARFQLSSGDPAAIRARMDELAARPEEAWSIPVPGPCSSGPRAILPPPSSTSAA